jgi:hypothetical protein
MIMRLFNNSIIGYDYSPFEEPDMSGVKEVKLAVIRGLVQFSRLDCLL